MSLSACAHRLHAVFPVAAPAGVLLFRYRHSGRSLLGQSVVGALLVLGPQGNLGPHHLSGLCRPPPHPPLALAEPPVPLSSVHDSGFPHRADDVAGCQLSVGWVA